MRKKGSDNNITLPGRLRQRRVQGFDLRKFTETIYAYLKLDLMGQSIIHAFLLDSMLVGRIVPYVGDLDSGFELLTTNATAWRSPQGGPFLRRLRQTIALTAMMQLHMMADHLGQQAPRRAPPSAPVGLRVRAASSGGSSTSSAACTLAYDGEINALP